MSIQETENRIRDLQELRRMKEALELEMSTLEDAIKSEMTARDTSDLTAGAFRVRWTAYQSDRIDTVALKRELPELAARYTKTTQARRFTIN